MLTPSSRMRNGLADDVLDRKTLLLMKVCIWCSAQIYHIPARVKMPIRVSHAAIFGVLPFSKSEIVRSG
jgi:hypothetical protein